MELNEFEVPQYCACSIGQSDAVAGSDFGVGSFAIEPARASGGEDSIWGPDNLRPGAAATADQSDTLIIVIREQIDDVEVLQYSYVGIPAGLLYEGLCNDSPGFIAVGVGDAGMRMASFECNVDASVFLVELCAPGKKLGNQFRPAANHQVNYV